VVAGGFYQTSTYKEETVTDEDYTSRVLELIDEFSDLVTDLRSTFSDEAAYHFLQVQMEKARQHLQNMGHQK
jgi:hypothetical protein